MFDPLYKWLAIPPHEQPPNHYRLLGIELFEEDAEVIDAAADRHLTYLHGLANGEHGEMAEDLANQVSAARLLLLNKEKKVVYDRMLREQQCVAERPAESQQLHHSSATAGSESDFRPKNSYDGVGGPRERSKASTWQYTVLPGFIILAVLVGLIAMGKLHLDREKMVAIGLPEEVAKSLANIDANREQPTEPVVEQQPSVKSQSPIETDPIVEAPSTTQFRPSFEPSSQSPNPARSVPESALQSANPNKTQQQVSPTPSPIPTAEPSKPDRRLAMHAEPVQHRDRRATASHAS